MFNELFFDEVRQVAEDKTVPWDMLRKKSILITGSTGLIGTTIVYALDSANIKYNLGLQIIVIVRNETKARIRFKKIKSPNMIQYIIGRVEECTDVMGDIDYIIHGASQTASKEFVNHAVETIETAILGTRNMLNIARKKNVSGFAYLSSMEVYGYPEKGHSITEDEIGTFVPYDLRNSYPISKIMSENMCFAFAAEYDVPTKIIRLAQTYGPGFSDNDSRIFAYIAKCIKDKQNIVLKTKGESERAYLFAKDASSAILMVLLKGEKGNAYNAADESTYCSIAEMAEKIAKQNGLKVVYDVEDEAANGFPKPQYMKLDAGKLRALGWRPHAKSDNWY